MQAVLEKFGPNPEQSFFVDKLSINHFNSPLHFHPQIEIIFIIEGTGIRFAGKSIQTFKPGEIVLIGEKIPHAFMSGKEHYDSERPKTSKVIFTLFRKEIFGDKFLSLPENQFLKNIISDANRCIKFSGKEALRLRDFMFGLAETDGFKRLNLLMQILYHMDCSEHKIYLNPPDISYENNLRNVNRINKVYEYVFTNYSKDIDLKSTAEIANLSPKSFCRYFKLHTKKTYSKFLAEVRIGQACKLLAENNESVKDIAYEVGFNHFSSFNNQFKNVMGTTALKYRKKISLQ